MTINEPGMLVTFRSPGNRGKLTVLWHGKKIGTLKPDGEFTYRFPSVIALHGVTVKGGQLGDTAQVSFPLQEVKP
jgi:hypothetical protein